MVVPPSPLSPDSDLVTIEEFYCLVPDGQKADLIDGVIYMASPDTRRSDRLGGFIKFLMQGYAAVQGLGEVYGSRFAFESGDEPRAVISSLVEYGAAARPWAPRTSNPPCATSDRRRRTGRICA